MIYYYHQQNYYNFVVVDYVVAHYSLLPLIQYFKVHDYMTNLSDHCMISVGLNVFSEKPKNLGDSELHDFVYNKMVME